MAINHRSPLFVNPWRRDPNLRFPTTSRTWTFAGAMYFPAAAGWSRVQGNSNDTGGAGSTTIAVTLSSAVGVGNVICGAVSWDSSFNLNSVTDNQGNTYNLETALTDTTNLQKSAAFSRTNIRNAPITITANFSGSAAFRKIIVDEFTGRTTISSDERDGSAHGGQFQNSPGTATEANT